MSVLADILCEEIWIVGCRKMQDFISFWSVYNILYGAYQFLNIFEQYWMEVVFGWNANLAHILYCDMKFLGRRSMQNYIIFRLVYNNLYVVWKYFKRFQEKWKIVHNRNACFWTPVLKKIVRRWISIYMQPDAKFNQLSVHI